MADGRSRSSFLVSGGVVALALIGCGGGSTGGDEDGAESSARDDAAALMGQFRYDDAVKALKPLADRTPSDGLRIDLAIALLNRRAGDDTERSVALLEAVLAESPENPRAQYCRALLAFHAGETERARALFERVAHTDPHDAYAVYYIGQCLFASGDYAGALAQYRLAQETDPYLRSAYYGEFQCQQRLRDADGAKSALAEFQRLAENPRARLAELKYTRMGPKAEVRAVGAPIAAKAKPAGAVFAEAAALAIAGDGGVDWNARPQSGFEPSITTADADGDGALDLLICGAAADGATLFLAGGEAGFAPLPDHPLSGADRVNAALWGDFDDDGLVDVYLCRRGPNQLWRQAAGGEWVDVADETGAAGAGADTVDGACFDVDHDGDLDYLLVNADGPREVLNNNRDGTFRDVAEELGVGGGEDGSRRVVVADVDGDDDADLVFLNADAPHEAWRNDRLWRYEAAEGFDELLEADITAAIAIDLDVDGRAEILAAGPYGVQRWSPGEDGRWSAKSLSSDAALQLAAFDCDGDAGVDLLVREAERWVLLDPRSGTEIESHPLTGAVGELAVIVRESGPEVLAANADGPPTRWAAGPGRHAFALARPVGRVDKAAEMRSNASGIGVLGAARVAGRWTPLPEGRRSSAVGQSLQPHAIGSAGAERIDSVRLLWPDGVSQTEIGLPVGETTVIPETQRQAGSCPLVFVWDGRRFAFVADLLGAGGLGFNLGRGEYYPPRPAENLLLPAGLLRPRDGRYVVKLGEPMEEVCYFDAVRLVAYDLPAGWSMTLAERFGGLGPGPTGAPVFYRRQIAPIGATDHEGEDVLPALADDDGRAARLRRADRRFIGLTEPHAVTLDFDEPIDALASPTLVFDGWVEYAYSQSAFAAWQAGEEFLEPTVEAQGADGVWRVVAERFGYPAGTSRQGSVALPRDALPEGARRLRITTNMQVYWDRFAIVDAEPCPAAVRAEAAPLRAKVLDVGFAERRLYDQRRSVYDYDHRPPFGDARHPAGYYTAWGDALPLVAAVDDAVAIIGPGEEVHLEFAADLPDPPDRWTRRWVLEANGWCKDADPFTKDSGTVGPLPRRPEASTSPDDEAQRERLHAEYNRRYRSGY